MNNTSLFYPFKSMHLFMEVMSFSQGFNDQVWSNELTLLKKKKL